MQIPSCRPQTLFMLYACVCLCACPLTGEGMKHAGLNVDDMLKKKKASN